MQLIEYTMPSKWRVIRESSDGIQKIKLSGTAGRMNEANKNKRVYPEKVLKSAVESLQEKVSNRELVGALDHPSQSNNLLSQASHLITKLWVDNNEVLWEAEVLPTPAGTILKNLIDANVRVGISSRGEGSLLQNDDGTSTVAEDFRLVTFDIVADPSTRGAYASLSESTENTNKVNGIIKESIGTQIFLALLKNKINTKINEGEVKRTNKIQKNKFVSDVGKERRDIDRQTRHDTGASQLSRKEEYPNSETDKEADMQAGRKSLKPLKSTSTPKGRLHSPVGSLKLATFKRTGKAVPERKPKLPESLINNAVNIMMESLETHGKKPNPELRKKTTQSILFGKKFLKKLGKNVSKDVSKNGKGDINSKVLKHDKELAKKFVSESKKVLSKVLSRLDESSEGLKSSLKSAQKGMRDAVLSMLKEIKSKDVESMEFYKLSSLVEQIREFLGQLNSLGYRIEDIEREEKYKEKPIPAPEPYIPPPPKTLKNMIK